MEYREIISVVKKAGEIISSNFYKDYSIKEKTKNDYVTSIDLEVEQFIKQKILSLYPDHSFLGEETALKNGNEYLWILDPIDGTKNFINHIPFFAISLALKYKNSVIFSIVYNPITKELFTGNENKSYLNNISLPIKRSSPFISFGFPGISVSNLDYNFFKKIKPYKLRLLGSASLILSYVASGSLDGAIFLNLKEWDYIAGLSIAKNAGARIYIKDNLIIAARGSYSHLIELSSFLANY